MRSVERALYYTKVSAIRWYHMPLNHGIADTKG